jgi:glyoxalase family protein
MADEATLTGIHHVTAVSADARANKRFYTELLGLRLVKRTVNQDDTSAYHLFYGDDAGSPGTDITFFEWPLPPERRGAHSVTRTALRLRDEAALGYWQDRLGGNSIMIERDGGPQLDFEDGEGQRLSLIVDSGAGDTPVPRTGSSVPEPHQIRGLGPVTMTVGDVGRSRPALEKVLKMEEVRRYKDGGAEVFVFAMGGGGPHAELHVAEQPGLPVARLGAGAVHHIAFRTPDEDHYHRWTERLTTKGVHHSGEVDRFWFRSLYFREPNGVLFEIATDGPGFAVDEDPSTLGESLVLPPFLEPDRAAISAGLTPLD